MEAVLIIAVCEPCLPLLRGRMRKEVMVSDFESISAGTLCVRDTMLLLSAGIAVGSNGRRRLLAEGGRTPPVQREADEDRMTSGSKVFCVLGGCPFGLWSGTDRCEEVLLVQGAPRFGLSANGDGVPETASNPTRRCDE